MTRADALTYGAARLRAAGIESPRREARLLLAHALGLDQESLIADLQADVAPDHYYELLNRRCNRDPLAYITGTREFWSLSLAVSEATLIPRPESETLIRAALACFPERTGVRRILDLGTGTGCLLIAALTEMPRAFGLGVDINRQAAALAKRNAARVGVAGRSSFVVGDWAAAVAGRFDLIFSNPPYIRSRAIETLMPEVAGYEPLAALDGGFDGMDAYRRILPALPRLLCSGGAAVLEIGQGEACGVADLARATGLTISVAEDLAGTPRALVLRTGFLKKPFGTIGQGV